MLCCSTSFNFKASNSFAIKEQCPHLAYSLLNSNTHAETSGTSKYLLLRYSSHLLRYYYVLAIRVDILYWLFQLMLTATPIDINILILQMRKLKLKELKLPFYGYIASK